MPKIPLKWVFLWSSWGLEAIRGVPGLDCHRREPMDQAGKHGVPAFYPQDGEKIDTR
jgi:hypothetical protein